MVKCCEGCTCREDDAAAPKGDDGGGGGLRYNDGKLRYDLVPVYWRKLLAQISTMGAEKYDDWNWAKGMKYSTPLASLQRHLAAWEEGERLDAESGLPHLAHVAWNALALAYYEEYLKGEDDRHVPVSEYMTSLFARSTS